MRHVINERKVFLAICFIGLGILLLTQLKLFAAPVVVSEKGLGLLLLAMVFLVSGSVLVAKAIRRIQE
jgi:hypothetical protein